MSTGYAPLIEAAAAELQRMLEQPPEDAAVRIGTLLSCVATCPACKVLQAVEVDQITHLVSHLATLEERDIYVRSSGLCLPHLHAAVATGPASEVAAFLLQEQVRCLEEIAEDMRSFALKRDAIRRGLVNTEEEHAWRRALIQLVGERRARVV